jgi:aspartyl-tRNA(Asn)/glutamyl-tRNA(Gln) amidotransferase subunit B
MVKLTPDDFEAVIGLEIHAELNTQSKLFSSAANRFGDEPNINISNVCTGQPGSLPVLNQEAVKKAVQFGGAINADVQLVSNFDRKSYFYPDSPRNFQITQFYNPIIRGGTVVTEVDGEAKEFSVQSAHLEDDAGMLKHFSSFAGVDYNRAGVPLIEIVSDPCFRTPKEASAYAMTVRAILQYIDASDCNMEEGSLRMDANISVRLKGEKELRPKIEIKNMNSFFNMELALQSEIKRQIQVYINGETIKQATYRFDPSTGTTVMMRTKEAADDYRYFPEPDLVPIVLTRHFVDEIKAALPELPMDKEKRYVKDLGLNHQSAFILVSDKTLADYFEEALNSCKNAKSLCNWMVIEFAGRYKESGKTLVNSGITPRQLASLVNLIDKGAITGRIAKSVADEMVVNPSMDPEDIVKANPNFNPVSDTASIRPICEEVVKNNPQSIEDFLQGRNKAFAFLVGQVMKATKGQASPSVVNTILNELIQKTKE